MGNGIGDIGEEGYADDPEVGQKKTDKKPEGDLMLPASPERVQKGEKSVTDDQDLKNHRKRLLSARSHRILMRSHPLWPFPRL